MNSENNIPMLEKMGFLLLIAHYVCVLLGVDQTSWDACAKSERRGGSFVCPVEQRRSCGCLYYC